MDKCIDCEDFAADDAVRPATTWHACSCYPNVEPQPFCDEHYEWRMRRFTCPDHGDV